MTGFRTGVGGAAKGAANTRIPRPGKIASMLAAARWLSLSELPRLAFLSD